ncbi:MAG: hypothetical protein AB8B93_01130 [Pseudomonadales bacterium]
MAQTVATLARAPLLKTDRISLGLITNQIAAMPAVTGITILGVNNEVLSMTREQARGRDYSHPIELDDAVIGYARVTVNPVAVDPQPLWPWVLGALLVVAMPWLLTLFAACNAALNETAERRRMSRNVAATQTPQAQAEYAAPPTPPADRYLVVANLLNQFALTAQERAQALNAAADGAALLAEHYDGSSEVIGDTGLALWFADHSSDRGEQIIGAALLITRLLPTLAHRGTFRVALHHLAASDDLDSTGAALRDAALMTAAAGADQVIVSSPGGRSLSAESLGTASAISHPLGADFTTAEPQCRRIETLSAAREVELRARLTALQDQLGSTDSESTF